MKHRCMGLLVALAAAILALTPVAGQPVDPAVRPGTRVTVFHPHMVAGRPINGRCWTSSEVAWRPDAWRCISGHFLLDPCFSASPRTSSVICQVYAPLGKGVRLNLTRPLPLSRQQPWPHPPHAWIAQLPDGTLCSALQGTPPFLKKPERTVPTFACFDGWFLADVHPGRVWTVTALRIKDTPLGGVVTRRTILHLAHVWL